jgi:Fic family protein
MSRRATGRYERVDVEGQALSAFLPDPLPPHDPPLALGPRLRDRLARAERALDRLELAGQLVPSPGGLLHGLMRREAVLSAQIAGAQVTLSDLLAFEADEYAIPSGDVADARHCLDALAHARERVTEPDGPPVSMRVLADVHRLLMRGSHGAEKRPGETRLEQTWIGGSSAASAVYVPPPPHALGGALSALEKYMTDGDGLPPLVRAGLVHVQFVTIRPFLDGNGRVARLLVPLLLERWRVLTRPLLYLSLYFKRESDEYHRRLAGVRVDGDWEGWLEFFFDAVAHVAEDGTVMVRDLVASMTADRARVLRNDTLSAAAVRLFELLPRRPLVTVAAAMKLLDASKPTAARAI